APLRPGEIATHFRFWLAHDTYQSVSAIQSVLFVNAVRHYLTTPGLAFHFFPCADPDFYAGVFAYADLARLPEADYEVDGRRYGAYGHDWRATPPAAWLTLMAERETALGVARMATPKPGSTLIVLSESDFAEAVRQALQDCTQADLLRGNPLLRSRLVLERAGQASDDASRAATLIALIKECAMTLLASPKDARLYRALEATYFKPAITQEQAAEQLDLPFSTYRRHLKSGLIRLAELLWQKEIGGG
ncbi:MAG: ATP-binding protein, partial [Anaerolineales bacterium]